MRGESMQIIIYALLNYINCAIKQDTNYEIAKCLLMHIDKIEKLSLEETANLCHVSVSTLNRFCRIIGFSNFSTLRHFIKIKEDVSLHFESNKTDPSEKKTLEKMNENMESIENIPMHLFDEISHLIHHSNRVILLGFGEFQFPALYFQNQMLSLGKLVEICGQINQNDVNEVNVEKNDLVIITSVHGNYLLANQKKIRQWNCRKVLLTQIQNQDLVSQYDLILKYGIHDDERLRKYTIMRVYEKIILNYYQHYHYKKND